MAGRCPALIFSLRSSEAGLASLGLNQPRHRPPSSHLQAPGQTMRLSNSGHLLLSLAMSALADNLALESQPYLAHTSCHTQYDHVTVVKQGQQGWWWWSWW